MTSNRKTAAHHLKWDRWYAKVAHRVTCHAVCRADGEPQADWPIKITDGYLGLNRQQKKWGSKR